jgi:hypothetical protein
MDKAQLELLETEVCPVESCPLKSRFVEKVIHHREHAHQILSLKEIQDRMCTSREKLRSKVEMLEMAADSFKTLQVKVVEAIEARK